MVYLIAGWAGPLKVRQACGFVDLICRTYRHLGQPAYQHSLSRSNDAQESLFTCGAAGLNGDRPSGRREETSTKHKQRGRADDHATDRVLRPAAAAAAAAALSLRSAACLSLLPATLPSNLLSSLHQTLQPQTLEIQCLHTPVVLSTTLANTRLFDHPALSISQTLNQSAAPRHRHFALPDRTQTPPSPAPIAFSVCLR